jgi:hypothetical protein
MLKNTVPICTQCKHSRVGTNTLNCYNSKLVKHGDINVITGYIPTFIYSCAEMRRGSACGPEGKLWEPRRKKLFGLF